MLTDDKQHSDACHRQCKLYSYLQAPMSPQPRTGLHARAGRFMQAVAEGAPRSTSTRHTSAVRRRNISRLLRARESTFCKHTEEGVCCQSLISGVRPTPRPTKKVRRAAFEDVTPGQERIR